MLFAGSKDDVEEHACAHQPGSDVHDSLPLLSGVLRERERGKCSDGYCENRQVPFRHAVQDRVLRDVYSDGLILRQLFVHHKS